MKGLGFHLLKYRKGQGNLGSTTVKKSRKRTGFVIYVLYFKGLRDHSK